MPVHQPVQRRLLTATNYYFDRVVITVKHFITTAVHCSRLSVSWYRQSISNNFGYFEVKLLRPLSWSIITWTLDWRNCCKLAGVGFKAVQRIRAPGLLPAKRTLELAVQTHISDVNLFRTLCNEYLDTATVDTRLLDIHSTHNQSMAAAWMRYRRSTAETHKRDKLLA